MATQRPPTLLELTQRLLEQEQLGLPTSEVEPYHQALPHPWINPQVLWPDAILAAQLLAPADQPCFAKCKMPAAWARRVGQLASVRLVPCGVGQVPAFLRDATPLMTHGMKALLQPQPAEAPVATDLEAPEEAASLQAQLLHAALARLSGRWEDAAARLSRLIELAPDGWHALLENETALLHWARGQHADAEKIWCQSAFATTSVYQFNRAIAALRRGDAQSARPLLSSAQTAFPTGTGWHALADLYLTVIE